MRSQNTTQELFSTVVSTLLEVTSEKGLNEEAFRITVGSILNGTTVREDVEILTSASNSEDTNNTVPVKNDTFTSVTPAINHSTTTDISLAELTTSSDPDIETSKNILSEFTTYISTQNNSQPVEFEENESTTISVVSSSTATSGPETTHHIGLTSAASESTIMSTFEGSGVGEISTTTTDAKSTSVPKEQTTYESVTTSYVISTPPDQESTQASLIPNKSTNAFYNSTATVSTKGIESTSSAALIWGLQPLHLGLIIAGAVVAIVVILLVLLYYCKRQKQLNEIKHSKSASDAWITRPGSSGVALTDITYRNGYDFEKGESGLEGLAQAPVVNIFASNNAAFDGDGASSEVACSPSHRDTLAARSKEAFSSPEKNRNKNLTPAQIPVLSPTKGISDHSSVKSEQASLNNSVGVSSDDESGRQKSFLHQSSFSPKKTKNDTDGSSPDLIPPSDAPPLPPAPPTPPAASASPTPDLATTGSSSIPPAPPPPPAI
ncbi:uncharacterized protein LOC120346385 [Styela clava]